MSETKNTKAKDSKLENLKNNSSGSKNTKTKHGGAREGSGRPLGKMNEDTKLRMEAKRRYLESVAQHADKIFQAQYSLAIGVNMLFKIKKDKKGNSLPPKQVTSELEIQHFFDELHGESGEASDGTYYFIAAQKPDNKAIKDMLDRSFGKPDEHIDLTSGGREIQQPKVISIIKARKKGK